MKEDRITKLSCHNCGWTILEDMKYCVKCGILNSYFNEKKLIKSFGVSIEEIVDKECNRGHPLSYETTSVFSIDFWIYCEFCGKKILAY